jgi:SNF2 family DNA or RNA helicase
VKRIRSFDFDQGQQHLEQPEGLRAILKPYQLAGLTWLNLLCDLGVGGILADDMGLGKTVQILALLQHRIVNQSDLAPQTILVVCPKSVRTHWLAQANNLVPRLKCHILKPCDLTGECRFTQHTLLLASYGLVRCNIDAFLKWKFDLLIIDEAQTIKNDSSQITQAIKKLSATQRFALTGTPIENRFEELISIFTFLNPCAQLNLGPAALTADAVHSLVQRALYPFVLRRLKEDVLTDLPPKRVSEVVLPMDPEQGRLHQELLEVYRNEVAKFRNANALPTENEAAFFLEGLLRLRQVATYPQQLIGDAFQHCVSNKVQYLCESIPGLIENGQRIVIFSQFLGFLRGVADGMRALDIRHSYVDGETREREQAVALFQSNAAIKVLLISLRVGGVGIDLSGADVCIIADPWWNDAVEMQAIDRLHRFGQKKPVTVLRLISAESIEGKMEILKKNKRELVDALGKTNPDFLHHLRWEHFAEIF